MVPLVKGLLLMAALKCVRTSNEVLEWVVFYFAKTTSGVEL